MRMLAGPVGAAADGGTRAKRELPVVVLGAPPLATPGNKCNS
jgi:hypothetical protein